MLADCGTIFAGLRGGCNGRSTCGAADRIVALLEIAASPLGNLQQRSAPSIAETLGLEFFHGATGRKVAIDVEEVIDSRMNIQKRCADPGHLKRCRFCSLVLRGHAPAAEMKLIPSRRPTSPPRSARRRRHRGSREATIRRARPPSAIPSDRCRRQRIRSRWPPARSCSASRTER
jgi:hypothetical protein